MSGRTIYIALAGLMPMHILLKRLAACSCARTATLGHSHPVRALLEPAQAGSAPPVPLGLGGLSLAVKHQLLSPAKDMLAECAEFTETFQVSHPEVQPGNRLLDLFPDRLVRHLAPKMSDDRYGDYIKQLDATLTASTSHLMHPPLLKEHSKHLWWPWFSGGV